MSFLQAEWRKLTIANYVIDKSHLLPYVPAGTVLDFVMLAEGSEITVENKKVIQ